MAKWPPTRVSKGHFESPAGCFPQSFKKLAWSSSEIKILEEVSPNFDPFRREVPTPKMSSLYENLRQLITVSWHFWIRNSLLSQFFCWEVLVGLENETTNKEANELAKTGMGDIMLQGVVARGS